MNDLKEIVSSVSSAFVVMNLIWCITLVVVIALFHGKFGERRKEQPEGTQETP